MSEVITLKNKAVQPRCRMAYTLGQMQPVLCTLLGNDPFFFDIDHDALTDEFEAALALEGASFNIPEALQTARTTSEGFITLGDAEEGLPLTDDLAALCATALLPREGLDIDAAIAHLSLSETGASLWAQAKANKVEIACDVRVERACLDVSANRIRINPSIDTVEATLLIARELRALTLNPVARSLRNPDNAILLNRAIQAELVTLPIQVAWELNLSGERAAWERLSASPLADLAYAYGHRASSDFRALRDGRAAMASFDQWFYSGRTRRADRTLIQGLLALGDELQNAPAAGVASTLDSLRAIGDRGIGRNYLLDTMMNLLQDGFYSDVRDRSNANFLWFVKFERSYRAAEAFVEATSDSVKSKDIPHGGATVLAFPDRLSKRAGKKTARKGKKDEADLVDLSARRSSF